MTNVYIFIAYVINFSLVFGKFVDLTHYLANTGTSTFPGQTPFKLNVQQAGPGGGNKWIAYNNFSTGEHAGTHLDSPYHFSKTGVKVADIPLQKLHGPGVVINVKSKVEMNLDYGVTVADLESWEAKHGMIPDNAIIVMFSDFGKRYGNDKEYYGTDVVGDSKNLHWPGFSKEAVLWLIKNRPLFLGLVVDSGGCDPGQTDEVYPIHNTLLVSGRVCLEDAANVNQLPEKGSHIFILPMKIKEGTGSPARSFAAWNETWLCASAATFRSSYCPILLFFSISVLCIQTLKCSPDLSSMMTLGHM